MTAERISVIICMKRTGKVSPMSFLTYWSAIVREGKPGSPTLEEARRDYRDALSRVTIVV